MGEQDESAKPALDKDNPDPPGGEEGDKGLGTQTGAEGGPGGNQDVTEMMPDRRGEVVYPDMEDPDELRSDAVPKQGSVDEDADRSDDASTGAKGD